MNRIRDEERKEREEEGRIKMNKTSWKRKGREEGELGKAVAIVIRIVVFYLS